MLSFIDTWLGKFIETVDLSNTLIILSSDHGSYIPFSETNPDEIPTIQGFLKKGKKFAPKLEHTGVKALLVMRKIAKEIRNSISKFKIIITKSTVPVSTGDEIEKIISQKKYNTL